MRFFACLYLMFLAGGCGTIPGLSSGDSPAPTTAASPQVSNKDMQGKVIEMLRVLMDTPRTVPAAGPRQAEVRGGAGSFAQLSGAEAREIADAIIYAGDKFLPKSLQPLQRYAIMAADGSAETAFRMESMKPRLPADKCAAGPYHAIPGVWVPIFKQRAVLPGLVKYDNTPWNPADTTCEMARDSIWMGTVLAWWEISEQAKAGAANPRAAEFHEDGPGPMPKTVKTGLLAHLLGYPEARKGPGSPGYEAQWPWYASSISTDLKMLGFDISLLDTPY